MRWISSALWLLALGFLGLYVYALVIGFFSPAEVVGISIAAIVLACAFALHAARVHHAMRDHAHPQHAELMRGLHRYRERRGF